MTVTDHSKRRVAYYYDRKLLYNKIVLIIPSNIKKWFLANIGNYYYGQGHVMKPHRIRMCHHLLLNYGLYRHLEVYRPFPASFDEMTRFHTNDYMQFLQSATPDNLRTFSKQMLKCKYTFNSWLWT